MTGNIIAFFLIWLFKVFKWAGLLLLYSGKTKVFIFLNHFLFHKTQNDSISLSLNPWCCEWLWKSAGNWGNPKAVGTVFPRPSQRDALGQGSHGTAWGALAPRQTERLGPFPFLSWYPKAWHHLSPALTHRSNLSHIPSVSLACNMNTEKCDTSNKADIKRITPPCSLLWGPVHSYIHSLMKAP